MNLKQMLPVLLLVLSLAPACNSNGENTRVGNEQDAEDREALAALIAETEKDLVMEDGSTTTLQEYMNQNKLYGLSIAVYENYELKWSKEYGVRDIASKLPVDRHTVYSTASIAKPYTAALAAILEEKGMLDLDAPVNSYLKRWKLPDNEFTQETPVTLRHLLTHTAGTTIHGFQDYGADMDIPTTVQILEGASPAFNDPVVVDIPVGSQWRYSGGGFVLAMLAIEDYTGEDFTELMEEYVFDPLGMKVSTFRQPGSEQFPDNAAAAHNRDAQLYPYKYPVTPELSASGLWANAEELPLLLLDIQKALAGRESRIISPAVAKYVTTEFFEGSKFGFSWALFQSWGNVEWFSHGGANSGIGAQVAATMEGGNAIAILGNGHNVVRMPLISMLMKRIPETHGWAKPEAKAEEMTEAAQ